jgi:hypothetical protein
MGSLCRMFCETSRESHLAIACPGLFPLALHHFTFAASSVMGDDVTRLGFPTCDAMDVLTFSSLGQQHGRGIISAAPSPRCHIGNRL